MLKMKGQFDFRISSPSELPEVLSLRDEVYTSGLGKNPDDGLDTVASHLAAYSPDGTIVAAFRVLEGPLRPFEFEHLFPLDKMVLAGRRPAMIGKLCVRPQYRNITSSTTILFGLLSLARTFAEAVSISDYYIYALPHLIRLYNRASFKEVNVQTEHAEWGLVHLMHMDVSPSSHGKRR